MTDFSRREAGKLVMMAGAAMAVGSFPADAYAFEGGDTIKAILCSSGPTASGFNNWTDEAVRAMVEQWRGQRSPFAMLTLRPKTSGRPLLTDALGFFVDLEYERYMDCGCAIASVRLIDKGSTGIFSWMRFAGISMADTSDLPRGASMGQPGWKIEARHNPKMIGAFVTQRDEHLHLAAQEYGLRSV